MEKLVSSKLNEWQNNFEKTIEAYWLDLSSAVKKEVE
jgi:hypothetical protein